MDDAAVVVDAAGCIASVEAYDDRGVDEDLRAGVLTPGFVDAHVHYPQTRIVGAATGPLLTWLERAVFPEEARFADLDHAARVAEIFCTRLAAAGTTSSLIYSSVHPDACDRLFAELERHGLRAIAGPVLMDRDAPPELQLDVDGALRGLDRLRERWHGTDDRLRLAVLPRFAISCSDDMLRRAGEYAHAHDLITSTHIAENEEECRHVRERFGTSSYLSVYEDAGLVRAGTVLAHCIHLTDEEWARMASAGAVVAHCPDSNAFLGSGSMPTSEVLAHEITLSLGSDIAAGRSFRIPAAISAAFDNALRVGVRLDPRQLLWWATRGGALALGHDTVGQIVAGREADMVLHEVPGWATDEASVLASICFDPDGTRVLRTWVRGREVWRGS
jgi:guanine deaminase